MQRGNGLKKHKVIQHRKEIGAKNKKTYEKGEIDSEAAAIILQDFLENFKMGSDEPLPRGIRSRYDDAATSTRLTA